MSGCKRICLTPVRNEAWIIKEFLSAAAFWADQIIVMDQVSTDGTREILRSNDSVDLICNDDGTYDESHRQKVLIQRARETNPGKRLFLALDADEFLSANCADSKEWAQVAEAEPGTVLRFKWVNVLPDLTHAWIPEERIACGFIDDGSEHRAERIHSRRVPWPEGARVIDLDEVVVLHFQYISPERTQSKHRWYQAWEKLNIAEKSALDIFRKYHHQLGSWASHEKQPVNPEWFAGFDRAEISYRDIRSEKITWWDREVLGMLRDFGPRHFRKFAIWDKDWDSVAREIGFAGGNFLDPRSRREKLVHRLLAASQGRRDWWLVRGFEKALRMTGW